MSTYKQFIPVTQPKGCNIQYAVTREECADVPACSMAEYSELVDRNKATSVNELRNLFCSAYLLGYMSPAAFYKAVEGNGLVDSLTEFLTAYATGVLALAAEAQNADPEPPVPVSGALRPEPSELVRVTAEARERRMNGRAVA